MDYTDDPVVISVRIRRAVRILLDEWFRDDPTREQQAIAILAGVSPTVISHLLTRGRLPGDITCAAIASAMGVSMSRLLEIARTDKRVVERRPLNEWLSKAVTSLGGNVPKAAQAAMLRKMHSRPNADYTQREIESELRALMSRNIANNMDSENAHRETVQRTKPSKRTVNAPKAAQKVHAHDSGSELSVGQTWTVPGDNGDVKFTIEAFEVVDDEMCAVGVTNPGEEQFAYSVSALESKKLGERLES